MSWRVKTLFARVSFGSRCSVAWNNPMPGNARSMEGPPK